MLLKDFEEKAGEKAGYLARIKKSDVRISAEFFVKACDILNVSMDLIASTNLTEISEQEKFTYDFLKRLATESSSKDWKQILGEWKLEFNSEYDIFESNIPFEQLPEPMRTYIIAKACFTFQARYFGDDSLGNVTQLQIQEAWQHLMEYELENNDYSILDNENVQQLLSR